MKYINPVPVKIEHTYDYEKFKLIGINRKVDKKHVSAIADAIQLRNLLHLFPLIVNKKFEVMDGQHRLSSVELIKTAKELHLPIYYIMDPNIELDDMRLLNSNKINWKNQDFINYYAGKGVKPFVKLVEFQKANPKLNLSCCLILLSSKGRDLKEMKNGRLVIDRVAHANEVLRYLADLRPKMDSQVPLWLNRDFIAALSRCVLTGKYNHEWMMNSQRSSPDMWMRQFNVANYIFEIQCTHNFGRTEKEKVNFRKLCSQ